MAGALTWNTENVDFIPEDATALLKQPEQCCAVARGLTCPVLTIGIKILDSFYNAL